MHEGKKSIVANFRYYYKITPLILDFTIDIYRELLLSFKDVGYAFQTFEEFIKTPKSKVVVLRHDVDLKAINSLQTAEIENKLGVKASYYFRVTPQSNQPHIIKEIVRLGHEIGYHYEDLSLYNGDKEKAIAHFEKQLAYFRTYYPVKTICMHGSPTSKIDNRSIWDSNTYKGFDIIGEPYFDVDFNKVFYLTDTGRCWDGERYSVRDKVNSSFQLSYHTSNEIIQALQKENLPNQIMITTHPQRWTNNKIQWLKELILQTVKNQIKRLLV